MLWPPHSTEILASICPRNSSEWSSDPHWSHLLGSFGIISAHWRSSLVLLNKMFPVFLHSSPNSTEHNRAVSWVSFVQSSQQPGCFKELPDRVKQGVQRKSDTVVFFIFTHLFVSFSSSACMVGAHECVLSCLYVCGCTWVHRCMSLQMHVCVLNNIPSGALMEPQSHWIRGRERTHHSPMGVCDLLSCTEHPPFPFLLSQNHHLGIGRGVQRRPHTSISLTHLRKSSARRNYPSGEGTLQHPAQTMVRQTFHGG